MEANPQKVYKQQTSAILVVVAALVVILLLDVWEDGWRDVNWIGLGIMGAVTVFAFFRIKYFGHILVGNGELKYWNLLFQREVIAIERIAEIDWRGLWFLALRVKIKDQSGELIERRITTGAISKKNVASLIRSLMHQNSNIQLQQGAAKLVNSSNTTE